MPVMACRADDKPGYKYGEGGHCYTYAENNEQSRKAAKRKAFLQGAAIESSRAEAAGRSSYKVKEYDNSMNDFIDKIRGAFERQFNPVMGGPVSPELPVYCWVTDVFEDYLIAKEGEEYYRVGFDVGETTVVFDEKADWEKVRLSYVTEMPATQFREVMFISEFKGKYPDIPLASGVDYDALVQGDDNPVFVTLPIGKVGAISGNRRFYDEAFVSELERQVLDNKPIGLMGHLSPEQRATEFPAEAVHWVGARRVGELLWGKGYVPRGESRERLQRYKATKKAIATSIDAIAEGVWDEGLSAYRMVAGSLKLSQIDIAPADRAGIADLAVIPHFTTEMASDVAYVQHLEQEPEMDKMQVINEMTATDAKLLPKPVRDAIIAEAPVPVEVTQVAAIRQTLGLAGDADPVTAIVEMQKAQDKQKADAIAARITELATTGEKAVKVESVRGVVIELVTVRQPKNLEEVDQVYGEVIETQNVKRLLQSQVREIMGPSLGTGNKGQANGNSSQWWEDEPAAKEA